MKKVTRVRTDDPKMKQFNVVVVGPVERVVEINPESVYMDGAPGDTLESTITVTPSDKFKFSVLKMEQKIKDRITAELIEPKGDEKSWQIKVKSHSEKPDDLYEVLTLTTDSKYKPTLVIRVYAIFMEKSKS